MKISHTVTEAEVLLGQISELDHSLSLLRRHQPVPQSSDCLEQLSESLSDMKLEKSQELSRKTAEVKQVEVDLGNLETAALGMQQEGLTVLLLHPSTGCPISQTSLCFC